MAGVYPLLPDETCWFLAADFDEANWASDAMAMLKTCHANGVPAALERSRSGNGGHVWIFFSEPAPARTARQLGAAMLTETMERRPEIGFASYDRFFPSQDNMPIGGFGNLIALPLQRRARELGNSVFIDDDLRPYEDQWAFLAAIPRLSVNAAAEIVRDAEMRGRVLGVRMPVEDEDADELWRMTPSRRPKAGPLGIPLPGKITIVVADQLYIGRTNLPSAMTARLMRLAAFQNPEFYRAQSMRLPTFGKPRIISCAELHPRHIGLPRGCLDEAVELIRCEGAEVELDDQRAIGNQLPSRVQFQGALHSPQVKAFDALAPHDYGVLAATTAFGKTVVAAALIAQRGRLSATVARKDGHHPVIFMQCGPVPHRVDARAQAAGRGISHRAKLRSTEFQLPQPLAAADRPSMPAVYAAIAQDELRNDLIFDDVLKALEAKRSPVVLTERRDHLEYLGSRFSRFVRNLIVLRGGMSAGERKAAQAALQISGAQERLILATGRYLGEGFDDPRLDALFLTMPISWKGTLAQYVGRLHRQRAGKTEVLVVDYVDELVPVLARMATKRRLGYRALGYTLE